MQFLSHGNSHNCLSKRLLACSILASFAIGGCISPTLNRQGQWNKQFSYFKAIQNDFSGTKSTLDCTDYAKWEIAKDGKSGVTVLQKARCYTHDTSIKETDRAALRNAIVEEAITIVNHIYGDFEQKELLTRGYIDTAFDVANLGLTAAAAVSSLGSTLGATATATLGMQSGVNKNFYNAQTTVAINSTMRALRLQQLAAIRQRETLTIVCTTTNNISPQAGSQPQCYTLEQALNDVQELYQVGTVQGALVEINNNSASKTNDAQSKLSTLTSQIVGGASTPRAAPGITAVTPSSAQVKVGQSQLFSAVGATGDVDWQVNGESGGDSTTGLIDSTGNYKAPASVPAPPDVTITAISKSDGTKATATVTIIH